MVLQRNWKLYTTGVLCSILILLLLYATFFLIVYEDMTNESLLIPKYPLSEDDHRGCNVFASSLKETDGSSATSLSQKDRSKNITSFRVSDRFSLFGVHNWICCYEKKLEKTFEESIEIVKNYPVGDSRSYLKKLGLGGDFVDIANPDVPVFVTAASSNHFHEVQALMHNIHNVLFPIFKELKFIFYDIGLNNIEKEMVRKHCRCEFRSFPFEDYPKHVKILQGYTFKPLIVQMVLNEFGFVFWIDASVRFTTGKLDSLFKVARNDGFLFNMGDLGVGYRTDPVTFKFLGEDPCFFADKNEIWATLFLMHRTRFTVETIMRPWVSCALTLGCMFFPGSQARLGCGNSVALGGCHRFDQSIIGIILWRLYHNDPRRFYIPHQLCQVQRGQTERYFESIEMKQII